jgi:hypothetical protein
MFIIKTAFWLSLVILCLPAGEESDQAVQTSVDAGSAITAAQSTFADLSGFCDRNPDVCETGGTLLASFGLKARYGALMIYEYLDDQFSSPRSAQAAHSPTPKSSGKA